MKKINPETTAEKFYELLKESFRLKLSPLPESFDISFMDDMIQRTMHEEDSNIYLSNGKYIFWGFPSGNLLQQVAKVFEMWLYLSKFPITFLPIEGLNEETPNVIEKLNTLTPLLQSVNSLFKEGKLNDKIQQSFRLFLTSLGMRGFLTCLGLRKTVGSKEKSLPLKSELKKSFNKFQSDLPEGPEYFSPELLYNQTGKGLKRLKGKSLITVGARALAKHHFRSSEGFWGTISGTELERNIYANTILDKFLAESVWINIHCLTHEEIMLELRVQKGYGARWTINGNFRGFLEPQMKMGHEKKWTH